MKLYVVDGSKSGAPMALAGLMLALATLGGCESKQASVAELTAASETADRVALADVASPAKAPKPALTWNDAPQLPTAPPWIVDAVFYQIFPERFRNGDPSNDPTHDSLEFPELTPKSWAVSSWTDDWYDRTVWEKEAGPNYFDNGVFNRRYGGDLAGVFAKLDYLQKLGVNTIYFNPVFYARSLHKYDGASMHHVDPYFGPDPAGDLALLAQETSDPKSWHWTAADKQFLDLVAELHKRKMHVIIDGVFNHTGRDFFAFADLRANQETSPYKDWYVVQRFDDPQTVQNDFRYKGWWNVDTLPEFADAPGGKDLHPGPKAYLFDITRRWMDPNGDGDTSDGVDGWRLDVANEVPVSFWKDWNKLVRELNSEAYTIAEIWDNARQFLEAGGFSATMNYHAFAFLAKGFLIDGRLSAHDFGRELDLRRGDYPPAMQFAMQNLVDSHDTERIASIVVNRPVDQAYEQPQRFDYDVGAHVSPRHDPKYSVQAPDALGRRLQRMIVLLQMTYVGAPMIYYGDEAGMWGGDDPCDRQPMVWDDLTYQPQTHDPLGRPRKADPVAFDEKLFDFYRRAIELRNDEAALRRGSWTALPENDESQFFAFRRDLGDNHVFVAFNRGDKPYVWEPPRSSGMLHVALSTEDGAWPQIEKSSDAARIALPPASAIVLSSQPPADENR